MREIYYRVSTPADVPATAAFVRIWRDGTTPLADVTTWDVDTTPYPTDPDIALVRAGLARARHDLLGIFVWLEDENLWQDEWGELRH